MDKYARVTHTHRCFTPSPRGAVRAGTPQSVVATPRHLPDQGPVEPLGTPVIVILPFPSSSTTSSSPLGGDMEVLLEGEIQTVGAVGHFSEGIRRRG